jgi:hypothetical protein
LKDGDDVGMYAQLKDLIEGRREWNDLTEHLKRKQQNYNELKDFQREQFSKLDKKLIHRVEQEIKPENFRGDEHGIWNAKTWLPILIKLSKIKHKNNDEKDCIFHEIYGNGKSEKSKVRPNHSVTTNGYVSM